MKRKITVHITGGEKELYLDKILDKPVLSTMLLKNATVYWWFKNIRKSIDVTVGTKTIAFEPGYWTFDMIAEFLAPHKVILKPIQHNAKCRVRSEAGDLKLGGLSKILGFDEKTITNKTWVTSDNVVDVNFNMRYITIACDLVNTSENSNTKGQRSKTLAVIPVTTEQSLFSSVTSLRGLDSDVIINNGRFNRILFNIGSNIGEYFKPSDVELLLELYVE